MTGGESEQDIAKSENSVNVVDQVTVVVKELKIVEIALVRISGVGQNCGVVDALKRELGDTRAGLKFSANTLEVAVDFLPAGSDPKRLNGAVAHIDTQVSPGKIALDGGGRCGKK